MNIRKYNQIKEKFESKISELSCEVEERWKVLIGGRCGYFNGWHIEKDMVEVNYKRSSGGDYDDVDEIPIRFFEIDEGEDAVEQYRAFCKQKETEANLNMIAEKRESRWKVFKTLKQEFEPNENILPKDSTKS